MGVHHGTQTGIGNIPLPTGIFRKVNGLFRAKIDADPTAFTINRVDDKIVADGIEPAHINTQSALGTAIKRDHGGVAAGEIGFLTDVGLQQKMQIRRIHVRITQHLVLAQGGKACRQAGFACSALAADDNEFFHPCPPCSTSRSILP